MIEKNGKQYEIVAIRCLQFAIVRTSGEDDKIVKIKFPPEEYGSMESAYTYLQSLSEI